MKKIEEGICQPQENYVTTPALLRDLQVRWGPVTNNDINSDKNKNNYNDT